MARSRKHVEPAGAKPVGRRVSGEVTRRQRNVTAEMFLEGLGVPLPGGWRSWSHDQQRKFVGVQKGLIRKRAQARKEIARRQEKEKFRGGDITFVPAEGADPDNPTFVIRGVYGPVSGLGKSLIAVKRREGRRLDGKFLARPGEFHQAGDIVEHIEDRPHARRGGSSGEWGPRKFLFELFKLAAKYGGDCQIYLTHNKMEIGLDAEAFEAWVRKSNEDPMTALLGVAPLLEDKSR